MSKREAGLAVVLTLGTVLMLGASPAAALCAFVCTCSTSCDAVCEDGPEIIDCPECNDTTCGAWGRCIDSGGCAGECPALSCTSTINGTSGGDTLTGNSADECIYGFDGNDTLIGNAGDDCADGGPGSDYCDAEFEVNCES